MGNNYIYTIGVIDTFPIAEYFGVPEEAILACSNSMMEYAQESTIGTSKDTKSILLGVLINTPGIKVVTGKGALKEQGAGGERAVLKEVYEHQIRMGKTDKILFPEEAILVAQALKRNIEYTKIANGKEDVVRILEELQFTCDIDPDDENLIIIRIPDAADMSIRYVSDAEIYLNGAPLKDTAVVSLAEDKWAACPQHIVGVKQPKELLEIMLAVLNQHRVEFGKKPKFAVGCVLGFSGMLGPDEREMDLLTDEGKEIKTKYLLGALGLSVDSAGRLWAGQAFSSSALELNNKPNIADICQYLYLVDPSRLYLPDNRGVQIIAVPTTELATDGGPLGITVKDGKIYFPGSNVKALKQAAASRCGKFTIKTIVSAVGDTCQGGQITMPGDLLATATGTRLVKVGGAHTYAATEQILASLESDITELKVGVGDIVHPGDYLGKFIGNELKWSAQDGAKEGLVVSVTRSLRPVGNKKNAPLRLVLEVEILATDKGAAKLREAVKAMCNSFEATEQENFLDGALVTDAAIAEDGLIKNSAMWNKRSKLISEGHTLVRRVKVIPEIMVEVKAKYEGDDRVTFDEANGIVIYTDTAAKLYEVTYLIESSSVQENVGSAAMTLYQLLFLSFTEAGRKILNELVSPDITDRVDLLGYLAALGAMPDPNKPHQKTFLTMGPIIAVVPQPNIPDVLDLGGANVRLLNDAQLFDLVEQLYPEGVNFAVSDELMAGIDLKKIRRATSTDGLAAGMTGIGEKVARLFRIFADPQMKAAMLNANPASVAGLIMAVKMDAASLAKSGGFGRVYGTRWGVTSKVVSSRAVALDAYHINPKGRIAKRLARKFKCKARDLEGKSVYVLRHPVMIGYVATIHLDDRVGEHVAMVNEMQWRRVNQGDFDGDTQCAFPIPEQHVAELRTQLRKVLPKQDMNFGLYGIPAEDEVFGMFGEKIDAALTVEQMTNKSKGQTYDEWFTAIKEGVEANTFWTGTSYRIMENGALQFALGMTNTKMMLMGAWLYEHKGLAGKAVGFNCKNFLQQWVWPLRDADAVAAMSSNMLKTLHEVRPDISSNSDQFLTLTHAVTVGNYLNRSIKQGAPQESLMKPFFGDQEAGYEEIVPLYRLLWLLGRKKLSLAMDDCRFVASEAMTNVALLRGFEDTFAFRMARAIASKINWVREQIGDLVDTEGQDDNDYVDSDFW
jgi:hypothetical protein